jgi:hypothetical protein
MRLCSLCCFLALTASAQEFPLQHQGAPLFPIGFYVLPQNPDAAQDMADAGVNIVRCGSRAELDRAQALGMAGIMPLPLQNGATDTLREQVAGVIDHPALVCWEGPDEVVWNFTAASMLFRTEGIHEEEGAWWKQTPKAVAYAQENGAEIIPNMRAAVAMIREMDSAKRPVWINEALRSDTYWVRQYFDFVDITGCDIYPVKKDQRPIADMGGATDRWVQMGRGEKPVFMVLQAFSWHELGEYYGHTEGAWPTFAESRFMAYDVIAHGADGILYWGSAFTENQPFIQSVYALTSELSKLHPFLTSPEAEGVTLELVELPEEVTAGEVRLIARQHGEDWLLALINEGETAYMGVVVNGLDALNGKELPLLYTDQSQPVHNGELITRLMPKEVQVFATSRDFETSRRDGREYTDQ